MQDSSPGLESPPLQSHLPRPLSLALVGLDSLFQPMGLKVQPAWKGHYGTPPPFPPQLGSPHQNCDNPLGNKFQGNASLPPCLDL